jgi:hypothetical protein
MLEWAQKAWILEEIWFGQPFMINSYKKKIYKELNRLKCRFSKQIMTDFLDY